MLKTIDIMVKQYIFGAFTTHNLNTKHQKTQQNK